ncbi:SIS domain-containing protein [Leucobacter allii]|uniref:MurR/RpiR family transcriptional regulator n=1 Tax=Leucobacter allii TaxID=2932247 RepID=UPI001FD48F31|nr:SIS domain-containing protein [Leucobacter allii]UOR02511.1 SIS domain-containing protein [Leucobacter allii]
MSTSLLQSISDRLPALSRSERAVAEYVLQHREEVTRMTLAAVSRAAGVSEPTVIRFCASMGFAGFRGFRLEMARFLALGVPTTHSAIEESDALPTIITKIFDHTISSLDHTRRSFDPDSVARAIALIEAADRLHFFGFGASSIIAEDAEQKAALFGKPCSALADPHQQFMTAATADTGDLFVLVSHTGRTVPLSTIASEARANGAHVITITGSSTGPLIDASDVAIVTATLEDTDVYTPTISRIAALVVIDILATTTAMKGEHVDLARLRGMKQKLAAFRSTLDPGSAPE